LRLRPAALARPAGLRPERAGAGHPGIAGADDGVLQRQGTAGAARHPRGVEAAVRPRKRYLIPNPLIATAIIVATVAIGIVAFTQELPFQGHYEVKATFASASNIRVGAPVRIAGIDVGKVTDVEHVALTADSG